VKHVFAFLLIAGAAGLAFWFWRAYQRFAERSRASDQRFASAMTDVMSTSKAVAPLLPPKANQDLVGAAQQKLLYEAASKAGEAGEAVLSIQLYARLIARYPGSTLGAQARAAVEAQKKKLTKP
jgi:predicted amino acid dehydrogenase